MAKSKKEEEVKYEEKVANLLALQSIFAIQANMQKQLDSIENAKYGIITYLLTIFGFLMSIITFVFLYWSTIPRLGHWLILILAFYFIVLIFRAGYKLFLISYGRSMKKKLEEERFDDNVKIVIDGAIEQMKYLENIYFDEIKKLDKTVFERIPVKSKRDIFNTEKG